ncbi:MAG: 2-oxo-4-hydroxy-4-carboxy-5-ureidoimidazoline decarboxylase, partial [Myxococcota bacterium]|nr:2-oxo-4-hydroxy-4-carboxy-5-ureidoimidazoline decarboxylase [Myxococcota bacterium]
GATPIQLRDEVQWHPVVRQIPLNAGSENLATADVTCAFTHVRLNIYPAGGVARLRIWGKAEIHPSTEVTNLASLEAGAKALCCSDMFFSPMDNLLKTQPAENMGQGWETRRGRPPTDDWVIIRLAQPGYLQTAIIDTAYFKGNYPETGQLFGICWPDAPPWALVANSNWTPISSVLQLGPDQSHETPISVPGPWTHVRLRIVPDGGVSRLRINGRPALKLLDSAPTGIRGLNELDHEAATRAFFRCCGSESWASAMADHRPFASLAHLEGAAEQTWWHLGDGHWLEAFTHHPEIGTDLTQLRARFGSTADLSSGEQSGVKNADENTLKTLAAANAKYKEQFGYIFIVCASGKSATEMLSILENRLPNEAPYELRVAAGEQAKITRLRLHKMLTDIAANQTEKEESR